MLGEEVYPTEDGLPPRRVSSISSKESEPRLPPDSPGSSTSTRLQEEYDELLKYAVVVPTYDSAMLARSLSGQRSGVSTANSRMLATQRFDNPLSSKPDSDSQLSSEHDRQEIEDIENHATDESHMTNGSRDDTMRPESPVPPGWTPSLHSVDSADVTDLPGTRHIESRYTSLDPDVTQMEGHLEHWLTDLKQNILKEYGQCKLRILEQYKEQILRERDRHSSDSSRIINEKEPLKELVHTYEQTLQRKNQVIANLTKSLQRHRERNELQKSFSEWKTKHSDSRRENFTSKLASIHHERSIKRRAWDAWHSVIENKWRLRVERACQAKAEEVCMSLTNDYETKLSSLNEALEASRLEVRRLHEERERYEETMKKAFMRGVCALNLEAMSMFHETDNKDGAAGECDHDDESEEADTPESFIPDYSTTVRQEAVYSTEPPGAPLPRTVTAQTRPGAATMQSKYMEAPKTRQPLQTGKVITTRVSARMDVPRSLGQSSSLAPPMSSVVVERHHPITKQTVGHATAMKYPRTSQQGVVHRKLAGQGGGVRATSPNIHMVKIVE